MLSSVRVACVLSSLLALALPGTARASCDAEAVLSTGVTVQRCTEPGQRWSVVLADLAASDVAVRVSASADRGTTPDAWMASVPGAVAVVQGGPFRFPGWAAVGLTVGEGERWPEGGDDGALAVLALDGESAGLVVPAPQVASVEPWMRSVVSGVPVLRAGAPVACQGDGCVRSPRTAIGLSSDGRTLVVIAVEGWTAESEGATDAELAMRAREAGAHDAIRVGEGATSQLATREGVGAIASSDGAPRAAGPLFALVDRGSGATGDLVGVVTRAEDAATLPAATVRIETTDGRVVVMRGTLNDNAYFHFTLPERTYVVRGSLAGYRDACRVCTVMRGREQWCSIFLEPGSGEAECSAPPRGVDAGTFPLADAGVARDAGASAEPEPRLDGGCAVGRGATGSWSVLVGWMLAMIAASVRRRGRR